MAAVVWSVTFFSKTSKRFLINKITPVFIALEDVKSDHVQDGSSKLANNNGNQNELKANDDVKAVETGMYSLIERLFSCVCHKYSNLIFVEFSNIT